MAKERNIAALYVRVSTAPQERGESLAVQEERLRSMAASRGMGVAEVFRDVASGADHDRPGLAAAVAAAGSYGALLVWDVTRFGRSAGESLRAVDRIHAAGAEVLDGQGRSSRDKLVTTILLAIAEYERDQIADRTSSARRAMAARGEWPTGPPPFGTTVPDEGPRLLRLDEEEAGWIRAAAERVIGGMTTGQVAEWLDVQGAPTPSRGRARWKYAAVAQLLKSPRLWEGVVEWRGEEIPHPVILDAGTAAALGAELGSRSPSGQRRPQRYPLSGHVICTCGAIWRSWASYNGPRGSRWYGCSRRDRGPASECDYGGPRKALPAERLEELVWAALLSLVDVGAFERRFAGEGGEDVSGELSRARATSARLERELAGLYRRDAGDPGAMSQAIKGAEEDLTAARREEARLASLQTDRETALAAVGRAQSALSRMRGDDPEEMARVLDDLKVRVQLDHPVGTEVLAWSIEAELMAEGYGERVGISPGDLPPEFRGLGGGSASFEKETALLLESEGQA